MIKDVLKQAVRDKKGYLRYLKYKNTLPKNPMHDDIYIVEFPKSGITWLQHILGNVELRLQNKKETITFYNHHKYTPDIYQLSNNINRIFDRTFIKSHAEFNPYYYFVIYLIRNPFDVMVSYYNFMSDQGYEKDFISFVKDSKLGIIAWKKHINSWIYKKVSVQRIHLVKYENLISQTSEEIKSIYKNLGLDIPNDILEYVISKSNIESMRYSENHYRHNNPNYTMSFVGKENKKSKSELLTPEIREYIQNIAYAEIKFFYPELIK